MVFSPRALFALFLVLSAVPASASAQTRPNLVVGGVSGPLEAVAGQPIDVRFILASLEVSSSARGALLLTRGGTSVGATELGRFGPLTLEAGPSLPRIERVTLPLDRTGIFRLAVRMDPDDVVDESNENDNLSFAAVEILIEAPQAELRIASVSLSETRSSPGEGLVVSVQVDNEGSAASEALSAAVVLGRDEVATPNDRELGRVTIPAVGSGASVGTGARVELPNDLGAGEWRVGVVLDPLGTRTDVLPDGRSALAPSPLVVVRSELILLSTTLPDATQGRAYDVGFAARGGDGAYAFSVSGALPMGLELNAAQRLSGTPAEVGSFELEIAVTSDGRRDVATTTLVVQRTGLDLQVATATLTEAFAGRAYLQPLVAGGGVPPYVWATDDPLPPGLTLSSDGLLSGTPVDVGAARFTARVRDTMGTERSARLTLVVSLTPIVLIQTASVAAVVGEALDVEFEALGGLEPLRWVAETPAPPGLSVTSDGRLTGLPTRAGAWPFQVSATDATTPGVRDLAFINVDVADPGALRITSGPMPEVPRFTLFEHVLTAEGGAPPYRWSLVPGDFLPPDFALVPGPEREQPADTGVIYGQAVIGTLSAFTVRVEDAYGRRSEQPLVFFVAESTAGVAGTGNGGGCASLRSSSGAGLVVALWGLGLVLRRRRRRSTPNLREI